ncbi:MAG: sle, partial [Myxococcaceae bacterium]|nr:sle [Myxococcaceae bacterium]
MTRRLAVLALLVGAGSSAQTVDSFSGLASSVYVASGLNGLAEPTDLRWLPDGRMLITSKGGTFYVRQTNGQLSSAGTFSVDSASEKGLLGLEVDPDFATNRRLYFYYSASNASGGTDLDRHRVVMRTLMANDQLAAGETILVRGLRGPANHDGGALAIGPDGKLYIGVGDTGCNATCCPATNRFNTCLTNGNGKILRVNLDGTIPSDNPLVLPDGGRATVTACGANCTSNVTPTVTGLARTDIWAWGFRNPWRISFDKVNGNLWVGDVGESAEEEIDVVKKGQHYGYPWFEGFRGGAGYDGGQCEFYTPGSGNCAVPVHSCPQSSQGAGTCLL